MLPHTFTPDLPLLEPDAWRSVVHRDLAGADFARRLVHRTLDGIEVAPLYTSGPTSPPPGVAPFTRGAGEAERREHGWDRCQVVAHPHPVHANEQALEDLESGATSVLLRLDRAARAADTDGVAVGGIAVHGAADLEAVLAGVHLDAAPVHLDAGVAGAQVAGWLLELWSRQGVVAPRAALNLDPLGDLARYGRAGSLDAAAGWALRTADQAHVTALAVHTDAWHHAGATPGQSLGFALASGIAHLRACQAMGLEPSRAAAQIVFHLRVDCEFFSAIAEQRALRLAWSRVLEACGVAPQPARIHVTLSDRAVARHDPWVNLLRNTVAVFAGGVGGADVVTSVPFDAALGASSAHARRIARNTATILMHESHLHRVADPAGGAWFVESLTAELAEAAWGWLQKVERAGGLLQALRDGTVAVWVDEAAEVRTAQLANRRRPLIGVSEYARPDEVLPETDAYDPAPVVARVEASGALRPHVEWVAEPLPVRRDSGPYDALRAAGGGEVTLVCLGPLARHNARAAWVTNLLAAGGVRARRAALGEPVGAVVVLCGADADYATDAGPAATTLRGSGVSRLYLAGRPGVQEDTLRAAGVDDFLFLGRSVPEVLADVLAALEDSR
ncbi:MAG: methylmalonyl-CoA mutase [Myxococcota bacterium]|jgi:methylmalonyl-CoA mutase